MDLATLPASPKVGKKFVARYPTHFQAIFSINLNAICFDFARQVHIERFMPAIFPEILQAEALYKQSLYQDNRYSSIRAAPVPRRRSAEVPGREPRRGIDPLHLSISCRRHELT